LEFIDSSGVGALLHVNRLLSEDRRPVRLTGVGKKVISLLELMHVHRSFDLNPAI
jgi:ABC-type transporter Mla MlaB component